MGHKLRGKTLAITDIRRTQIKYKIFLETVFYNGRDTIWWNTSKGKAVIVVINFAGKLLR